MGLAGKLERTNNAHDSYAKGPGAHRLGELDHIGRAILLAPLNSACPSSGVDSKVSEGMTESDHFPSPLSKST